MSGRDLATSGVMDGPSVAAVSAAKRRQAALNLAGAALEHPELRYESEQLEALSEVLSALGFKTRETELFTLLRQRELEQRFRDQDSRVAGEARRKLLPTVNRHATVARCDAAVRGTERGYRRHLTAYQTPCPECTAWRVRQLDKRWEALGVNPNSEVVLPS